MATEIATTVIDGGSWHLTGKDQECHENYIMYILFSKELWASYVNSVLGQRRPGLHGPVSQD